MGIRTFVWDVETTGISVFEDRIVQFFGAVVDEQGKVVEEHEIFINPGVPVPEGASDIHGFTTEFLAENGVSPKEGLSQVKELFLTHKGLLQVAFNMNYDLSIIDAEMKRHGVSDNFGKWFAENGKLFDGLVVDRYKDRFRKGKRTLEAQCEHYGVEFNPDEAHNALYDVLKTAQVSQKIIDKYGLPTTQEQQKWQEQWRSGFEKYLQRKDPSAKVEKGWPLREEAG